jgi:hypothetical protein
VRALDVEKLTRGMSQNIVADAVGYIPVVTRRVSNGRHAMIKRHRATVAKNI